MTDSSVAKLKLRHCALPHPPGHTLSTPPISIAPSHTHLHPPTSTPKMSGVECTNFVAMLVALDEHLAANPAAIEALGLKDRAKAKVPS